MKIRPSRLHRSVESTKHDPKASDSKLKDQSSAPSNSQDLLNMIKSEPKSKS